MKIGIVSVLSLLLLGGAGCTSESPLSLQNDTQNYEAIEEKDEIPADEQAPSEGVNVYTNTTYDTSFAYPNSFTITEDKEVMTYSTGVVWYRVIIENKADVQEPWMSFEINPDGYGPIFADLTYTLEKGTDGYLSIASEEVEEKNEFNNDGNIIITARYTSESGISYFWFFRADEGVTQWENTFKEILVSTRLP
ncbi:MAG: hypothetical protein AAB448_00705 [Patescibacteria group bacterium]